MSSRKGDKRRGPQKGCLPGNDNNLSQTSPLLQLRPRLVGGIEGDDAFERARFVEIGGERVEDRGALLREPIVISLKSAGLGASPAISQACRVGTR